MTPAARGVERATRRLPLSAERSYLDRDGHADRLSRLARRALAGDAAFLALVAGDGSVLVGQDGWIPHLDLAGIVTDGEPGHGRLTLVEPDHPDRRWALAYAGIPIEVAGLMVTALVGVLHADPWTWTPAQLACVEEFAPLAVSVVQDGLRDETEDRIEELVPRLVAPLAELDDVVRRTSDLVETPEDPRLPRMADVVRRRLAALELVAGQLEEVSRGATFTWVSRPDVDLGRLVGVVAARSVTTDPRSDLLVELPDRPVWVRAAIAPLDRALSRLLAAAIHDADPAGRGLVRVTGDGQVATVEVAVPGSGIPLPDLVRLVGAVTALVLGSSPVSMQLGEKGLQIRSRGLEARSDASGTVVRLVLSEVGAGDDASHEQVAT